MLIIQWSLKKEKKQVWSLRQLQHENMFQLVKTEGAFKKPRSCVALFSLSLMRERERERTQDHKHHHSPPSPPNSPSLLAHLRVHQATPTLGIELEGQDRFQLQSTSQIDLSQHVRCISSLNGSHSRKYTRFCQLIKAYHHS